MPLFVYAAIIFTSAFLLFQVQPIIARIILPWFGGSAAVWTVCLLFFQVGLLLGYLYAHWSVRYLRPKLQALLHLGLLAVSLLSLPILPGSGWKPQGNEDPTLRILLLLVATVGLPYFLLSTTGPLLQAWYARSRQHRLAMPFGEELDTHREPDAHRDDAGQHDDDGPRVFPYRLYALSNLGSMLALLSYPGLVEPYLSIRQQSWGWSTGYVLFALLCGAVAWRERGGQSGRAEHERTPQTGQPPGWRLHLYWLALAACASTLLLAVTNHLSQNVAAIPFLWVLSLSLYVLSFILCFGGETWQWKPALLPLPALAVGGMTYALSHNFQNLSLGIVVPIFAAGLFICCVLCHGELARTKPHPQHLTSFYLMMSIGGALGGLFVGVIAPHVFRDYFELPVAIAGCALIALFVLCRAAAPPWKTPASVVLGGLTLALIGLLADDMRQAAREYRLTERNFYGVLRISEQRAASTENNIRFLTHGTILHGSQFLGPQRRRLPTTYYGPQTGAGLAVRESGQRLKRQRVGVIGLGTGTLAAYGRTGDVYRFYDINPLAVHLANTQFSFVKDSRAGVEIVPGDARLALEREPKQNYDVLVVDAFSGDSIPVHLLTREAFALYFRQMKPGGVLAVHVSNRYLRLAPVVAGVARSLGKQAMIVESKDDETNDVSTADWVLVTARPGFFKGALLAGAAEPVRVPAGLRIWTDDYSNLYQTLKR